MTEIIAENIRKKRLTMLDETELKNFNDNFEVNIWHYFGEEIKVYPYDENKVDKQLFDYLYNSIATEEKFSGLDIVEDEIPFLTKKAIDTMSKESVLEDEEVYLEVQEIITKFKLEDEIPNDMLNFGLFFYHIKRVEEAIKDRKRTHSVSLKESTIERLKEYCSVTGHNQSKIIEQTILNYLDTEGKAILEKFEQQKTNKTNLQEF